jgi:hypothetical protein
LFSSTNRIVCVRDCSSRSASGERLVFRVFGTGTDRLVDRPAELANFYSSQLILIYL